jgi:hypothetical protein
MTAVLVTACYDRFENIIDLLNRMGHEASKKDHRQ